MEQTQDKPTSARKRIPEPQVEGGSEKGRKKLKKARTEPREGTGSEEKQIKKIMQFKNLEQKLTEREKSKKVLLKKLQKLRKSGGPVSEAEMTTVNIEQKETKTKSSTASSIKRETCKIGESSLKLQEMETKTGKSKKKMSPTDGCVNKEDAEWYQNSVSIAFNQLKNGMLQGEQLQMVVQKFTLEICRCMQHIKLQPGVELVEVQDIVDTIADKEGTALKSFLKGELVLSKDVWQQLIDLKFWVTVSRNKQITKQLEEGIYGRNAKTPEEETYLRNKIAYIFKHRGKAYKHNAKVAEGLSELAQQMGNLSDFYVVAQAATVDEIIINSLSIDRILKEQKSNKKRQDKLLQEHLTSKAVEETCLPLMKDDWAEGSFKLTRQLAAKVVYFMRKNLFKEANVESIADKFKLKKQQLYKLVSGKKLKSGKVTK